MSDPVEREVTQTAVEVGPDVPQAERVEIDRILAGCLNGTTDIQLQLLAEQARLASILRANQMHEPDCTAPQGFMGGRWVVEPEPEHPCTCWLSPLWRKSERLPQPVVRQLPPHRPPIPPKTLWPLPPGGA